MRWTGIILIICIVIFSIFVANVANLINITKFQQTNLNLNDADHKWKGHQNYHQIDDDEDHIMWFIQVHYSF